MARANALHDEIYETRVITHGQNTEINNVLTTAVDDAVTSQRSEASTMMSPDFGPPGILPGMTFP